MLHCVLLTLKFHARKEMLEHDVVKAAIEQQQQQPQQEEACLAHACVPNVI